ncbi:MAG: hypothetical protein HYY18_03455 [Planctomycetes bacterium]|nr:hypothetical protein [Planctomycetota bacterium]
MIRSPIPRVLSTLSRNGVRALLMGGQACVLYGGAEFSRDVDVAIAADGRNLARLQRALKELRAEPVYFPELSAAVLKRGHACHFRCRGPRLDGIRLDIMSVMRGLGSFASLWKRRTVVELPGGTRVPLLSLPDLVSAKKTQRDKDWPMIRRLIEADVAAAPQSPGITRVRFWLRECRTPELLIELARRSPGLARREARMRRALRAAIREEAAKVSSALAAEEAAERARDERYWSPLKSALEAMRLGRRKP